MSKILYIFVSSIKSMILLNKIVSRSLSVDYWKKIFPIWWCCCCCSCCCCCCRNLSKNVQKLRQKCTTELLAVSLNIRLWKKMFYLISNLFWIWSWKCQKILQQFIAAGIQILKKSKVLQIYFSAKAWLFALVLALIFKK